MPAGGGVVGCVKTPLLRLALGCALTAARAGEQTRSLRQEICIEVRESHKQAKSFGGGGVQAWGRGRNPGGWRVQDPSFAGSSPHPLSAATSPRRLRLQTGLPKPPSPWGVEGGRPASGLQRDSGVKTHEPLCGDAERKLEAGTSIQRVEPLPSPSNRKEIVTS